MEPIVNRVAESEIEVYNLEDLWDERTVVEFDLAPFLHRGLVLREVAFREKVKEHDFDQYRDAHVAVSCSADAIVPTWAYMLIASKLKDRAASVAFGSRDDLIRDHFVRRLEAENWERYRDGIVVIKGCGSSIVPSNAYLIATQKLQKVVRKLMYGEPCSSVQNTRSSATAGVLSVAFPSRSRRHNVVPSSGSSSHTYCRDGTTTPAGVATGGSTSWSSSSRRHCRSPVAALYAAARDGQLVTYTVPSRTAGRRG